MADAGYASEANFLALQLREQHACVALGREGKKGQTTDAEQRPATARMAQRMATEAGKRDYARRGVIPEPVFGWIKAMLGFRRFSVRGLPVVTAE